MSILTPTSPTAVAPAVAGLFARRRGTDPQARARTILLSAARAQPTSEAAERLLADSTPECWELAAEAALRTHQEPLLQHFIAKHCPQAPLSLATKQSLEAQKKLHAFRWEELQESLDGAVEALGEAGIQPLLLKGAGCVGDLYHLPRLRPMRDLDILVRRNELQAAEDALLGWGFIRSEYLPSEDYESHHHAAPLFHPQTKVCIELHHHPLCKGARLKGVPSEDGFWADARERIAPSGTGSALPGTSALVLEPTLSLLVTGLHFTHGDHIGDRIAHLFDVTRLVELRADELDWERALSMARDPAVASSLALTLLYLELEGLPSAPPGVLDQFCQNSTLRPWEFKTLVGLVDRYRIGLPGPRRGMSPRIGNILWHRILERRPLWQRACHGTADVLSRGRRSRQLTRANRAARAAGTP